MLTEDRKMEIWEEVVEELYEKGFDFENLDMEVDTEVEYTNWNCPMADAGGDTRAATISYTFDYEELRDAFDNGDLEGRIEEYFKYLAKNEPEKYEGVRIAADKVKDIDAAATPEMLADETLYKEYLTTIISDAATYWLENTAESELEDEVIEKGEETSYEPDEDWYRDRD